MRGKLMDSSCYKRKKETSAWLCSVVEPLKTSFHVSFLSRVKMNSINWSAPNIYGSFMIAQLVEHCSANEKTIRIPLKP